MMPLSMEATDVLSLGGELEVSRENSSGSSSWQSTASNSFVAVMVVPSALRLKRQRMRQSSVPCGKSSASLETEVNNYGKRSFKCSGTGSNASFGLTPKGRG
jgi:hypothetical protein